MLNRLMRSQRLVALFFLGCVLFGYPLLELFDHGGDIFGIPLLFAYIFAAWVVLIVLIVAVVEGSG